MTSYYKRLYLICLLLATTFGASAQQICGTTAPDPAEEARLAKVLQQAIQSRDAKGNLEDEMYYVPLKIHILRHSNGEVAIAENRVLEHITATNKHFLDAGIQFYLVGDFNYIDLDQAFYLKYNEHQILTSNTANYKEAGMINLFYPHSIDGPLGFAEYPPSTYVVVAGNISEPKTLIHELGHSFFRLHTHEGNNSNMAELVDGSNCHVGGDYICDTPADPYGLPGATVDVNGYTGTIVDANGDLYAPMIENFMSYWQNSYIYQKFTLQQMQLTRLVYENYFGPTGYYPFNHNQVPVNAPSALTASFQAGVNTPSFVHLTWQDNSTNETSFFIERSTFPDHDFYSVGYSEKNTTSFGDKTLAADQTYYYRIRPVNSKNSFSNVVSIQTPAFYCVPSADPCSTHSKIINSFNISYGNTVIVNGNPATCFSYNFLSLPTSILNVENSYTLSLKIENDHDMFSTAWIDFNRNMHFEEEEVIYSSNSATNLHTASFDVPENLADGIYRLRIRAESSQKEGRTSCAAEYFFGEIRDIEFSIAARVAPQITWDPIEDKSMGDPPFTISAKSSSTQAISYSVVSGPAVLEGNLLRLTGTGIVVLRASQAISQTGEVNSEDISFCVLPSMPHLTISGTMLTSSNAHGNQWYLNGQPITNAIQQTYQAATTGEYAVETIGPCGDGVRSDVVYLIVTGIEKEVPNAGIMVYPNPVDDEVNIKIPEGYRWEKIEILDMNGIRVAEKCFEDGSSVTFITRKLAAGFYVVRISTSAHVLSKKFVIQR